MTISVHVEIDTLPPAGWDDYVDSHANSTAYHRSSAVLIGRSAFGLSTFFLVARDDLSRLIGVLPLVQQSSVLFGRFLVSVPFFTYGGILANDDSVALELARRAVELAKARNAKHLELRHVAPIDGLSLTDRLEKVSMILPLPRTEIELGKQLGAKLRSQIRRADRESPQIIWGSAECIPDFYRVFSRSMRDLGTPVYPRRFFDICFEAFGSLASILVVRVQGDVQAVALVVRHRDRIEVPWAAATPAAKRSAINMRMYWEMLKFALDRGAAAFDFGRSSIQSGTYRFKAQWGAVALQLHWHYWLPAGADIPQLNNSNPKYAMAGAIWRRMPLWCANALGPHIVRNLP